MVSLLDTWGGNIPTLDQQVYNYVGNLLGVILPDPPKDGETMICEVEERIKRWPYSRRCRGEAVALVTWEEDGNDYSKNVCRKHREEVYITPDVEVKDFTNEG